MAPGGRDLWTSSSPNPATAGSLGQDARQGGQEGWDTGRERQRAARRAACSSSGSAALQEGSRAARQTAEEPHAPTRAGRPGPPTARLGGKSWRDETSTELLAGARKHPDRHFEKGRRRQRPERRLRARGRGPARHSARGTEPSSPLQTALATAARPRSARGRAAQPAVPRRRSARRHGAATRPGGAETRIP